MKEIVNTGNYFLSAILLKPAEWLLFFPASQQKIVLNAVTNTIKATSKYFCFKIRGYSLIRNVAQSPSTASFYKNREIIR